MRDSLTDFYDGFVTLKTQFGMGLLAIIFGYSASLPSVSSEEMVALFGAGEKGIMIVAGDGKRLCPFEVLRLS